MAFVGFFIIERRTELPTTKSLTGDILKSFNSGRGCTMTVCSTNMKLFRMLLAIIVVLPSLIPFITPFIKVAIFGFLLS